MARFDSLSAWLDWQQNLHPRAIDLDLKRVANVFSALNANLKKPPTIIVAGTNGKGSSVAFLDAIYRAQGYRVGAYTSPHIGTYNERIRVAGQAVTDAEICQSFARIDALRRQLSLSYFEFGTLAALDIFARSNLDLQLLEVGLGGRLDAVNIIDADVCLVTTIGIDHSDWLGATREAIGYEKSGIFRAEVPAVVSDLEPPDSLLASARKIRAPLFCINQQFSYRINDNGCWSWSADANQQLPTYDALPAPALPGKHQYPNAAAVLMVIAQLQRRLAVGEAAIRKGLQTTQLKGRFQLIEAKIPVLLDVAHNPQAVSALLDYLRDAFAGKRIIAIFSMMKDKDIVGAIKIINPIIAHWYFAPLDTPRAADKSMISECFSQCGINRVTLNGKSLAEAYSTAKIDAKTGDLLLVFGSFFLVSQFLSNVANK